MDTKDIMLIRNVLNKYQDTQLYSGAIDDIIDDIILKDSSN